MKKQEEQLIKFLGGLAGGYIGSYFLLNLVKNQNIKPDFKALGLVGLGIALPILVKDKKLMPIVSGVGVGLALKGSQDYVNNLAMRDLQKQTQNQPTVADVGFLPEPTLQGDELPEQLDQQDIFYTDENENLYIVIKAPNTTTLIDANTGDVVAVNTKNAKHFELNQDKKEVKFLNQVTLQGMEQETEDESIKDLFENEISEDIYSY